MKYDELFLKANGIKEHTKNQEVFFSAMKPYAEKPTNTWWTLAMQRVT